MKHPHRGLIDAEQARDPGFNLAAALDQHGRARATTEATRVRWLPVLGGGLLLGYGLSRPNLGGVLLALAGGGLAAYGLSGRLPLAGGMQIAPEGERSIRVEKVVTVNVPPERAYAAWRDIEQLPRYMSHLESVRVTGDGRSHWVAKAPAGRTVEWDAEVIHDEEQRVIAWRSVGETAVPNVGAVHFQPAPGPDGAPRGTEVRVRIEYLPPAGRLGATVAKLFGEEPSQQVADDLRRFKQLMEAGEVPTTAGQPRGNRRKSLVDAGMEQARRLVEAADVSAVTRNA